MYRGKVIRTDGIRLPDGQDMKDIDEAGYTFLDILETDMIKEKEMKEKFSKEYLQLLNVVSTIFSLVCFLSIKESTCQTRTNVSYFTSKALFVLEIIKFQLFRYSNVVTSSNAQAQNIKNILLNNLGSKHGLAMKFGQFM